MGPGCKDLEFFWACKNASHIKMDDLSDECMYGILCMDFVNEWKKETKMFTDMVVHKKVL